MPRGQRGSRQAEQRFALGEEVGYEACAHHLSRMFNAIEQMGLRVAKAFENHIDDEQGCLTGLLKQLGLSIPGIRPALFPPELKLPLSELKGFRHVIVHAYELELDPAKLRLLLGYAARVSERLEGLVADFIRKVTEEQGLDS